MVFSGDKNAASSSASWYTTSSSHGLGQVGEDALPREAVMYPLVKAVSAAEKSAGRVAGSGGFSGTAAWWTDVSRC